MRRHRRSMRRRRRSMWRRRRLGARCGDVWVRAWVIRCDYIGNRRSIRRRFRSMRRRRRSLQRRRRLMRRHRRSRGVSGDIGAEFPVIAELVYLRKCVTELLIMEIWVLFPNLWLYLFPVCWWFEWPSSGVVGFYNHEPSLSCGLWQRNRLWLRSLVVGPTHAHGGTLDLLMPDWCSWLRTGCSPLLL